MTLGFIPFYNRVWWNFQKYRNYLWKVLDVCPKQIYVVGYIPNTGGMVYIPEIYELPILPGNVTGPKPDVKRNASVSLDKFRQIPFYPRQEIRKSSTWSTFKLYMKFYLLQQIKMFS